MPATTAEYKDYNNPCDWTISKEGGIENTVLTFRELRMLTGERLQIGKSILFQILRDLNGKQELTYGGWYKAK